MFTSEYGCFDIRMNKSQMANKAKGDNHSHDAQDESDPVGRAFKGQEWSNNNGQKSTQKVEDATGNAVKDKTV